MLAHGRQILLEPLGATAFRRILSTSFDKPTKYFPERMMTMKIWIAADFLIPNPTMGCDDLTTIASDDLWFTE